MKIKRIILLLLALIFLTPSGKAQFSYHSRRFQGVGKTTHFEFSANVGAGGLSLFHQNTSSGFAGNLGVGAVYEINEDWAIVSGLEMAFHSAKTEDPVAGTYSINGNPLYPADPMMQKDVVAFSYGTRTYSESHNIVYLNIPIMWRFNYAFEKKYVSSSMGNYLFSGSKFYNFYFMAGAKIILPLTTSYKSTYEGFHTEAQSQITGNLYDNQNENAFFKDTSFVRSGNIPLSLGLALSAEAGYQWPLNNIYNLYAGIYVDYAMMSLSGDSKGAVELNTQKYPFVADVNSALVASNGLKAMTVGAMVRITRKYVRQYVPVGKVTKVKSFERESKVMAF